MIDTSCPPIKDELVARKQHNVKLLRYYVENNSSKPHECKIGLCYISNGARHVDRKENEHDEFGQDSKEIARGEHNHQG